MATAALFSTSCDKDGRCVNGSGAYQSRSYSVSSFDEISFYGEGDVYVTRDSVSSVSVEAQQNVLDALNLDVRNGELRIGRDNCFRSSRRIRVYVTTPNLSMASISGSGNIIGTGIFSGPDFRADISGSGNIDMDLDVETLNSHSSGSGEVTFRGNATYQYFDISGSGSVHCFNLSGREGNIRISGSGNCEVNVSDELEVDISGSGNVYYKGSPHINSKISGSGKLVNRP